MTIPSFTEARRARLVAAIDAAGLDAAVLVPGPNLRYALDARFHLMERATLALVKRDGGMLALMPALERAKWESLAPGAETFYWRDEDGPAAAFDALAAAAGPLKRIGVEGRTMRVFEGAALARVFGAEAVVDAHDALAAIRLAKDASEIATIERAIAISEAAFEAVLPQIRLGMSEVEIKGLLLSALFAGGADGLAFEPIVLAGGASANPHGVSSDSRRLAAGDPLLFDFGASVDGYSADITRTVFAASIGDEHRALYETVERANLAGREAAAAPGATPESVDAAAAGALRASPFADLIRHKTGHGLGLEVHEAPQVMSGVTAPMPAGTVITVEPGLYHLGEIGVRIEDDVLITPEGARSLTALERGVRLVAA